MMESIRRLFGRAPTAAAPSKPAAPPPDPEPEVETVIVPEISVAELQNALQQGEPILVLDVRENYEWAQAHLPTGEGWEVIHMPMNSIPSRMGELPSERTIAVLCAHGNRSYGVTHYLNQNGLRALNVTGGISRWAQSGGRVEK